MTLLLTTSGLPIVVASFGSDDEFILRQDSRDPQPVVEHERVIPGVVSGPSHLHDPQLPLHPELPLAGEPQVEDSVREVFLLVLRVRRAGGAIRPHVGRQLAEEEGRALQVAEPVDEGEHLLSRLSELGEDFEGIEGIEDEQTVIEGLANPLRVQLEQIHPRLRGRTGQLLPQGAQVEDAQFPVRVFQPVSESLRMIDEARPALFQGDVEAADAGEGVGMQDVVRQGRLHRARSSGDENDAPRRDAAAEDFVEAFHFRRDAVHSGPSAIRTRFFRIDSICRWIRSFSCGRSTTSARLPRSTAARSAIRTRSALLRSSGSLPRLASCLRKTPSPASPSWSTKTARARSNNGSGSLKASAAAKSSSISLPFQ